MDINKFTYESPNLSQEYYTFKVKIEGEDEYVRIIQYGDEDHQETLITMVKKFK